MPQSYVSLYTHFVFSTKHRRPIIVEEMQARLFEYIGGIVRSERGKLIAAGGMPDHVALLVSVPKEKSTSETMRDVKTNSSAWIHNTFDSLADFAWQAGYGAFSVGYSNLDVVKRYIANQKRHHLKRTFQEEFVEFLTRYDIEYDEKYLWE
jgi:putative transposase